MRWINSSDFRIARRGTSRVINRQSEITTAWDLLESMVRDAMREQALTLQAAETPISVVPLSDHPRLRGAAALILTPAFAAPTIA